MRVIAVIGLAIFISGCATSSQNFDRDNVAWASTIVGCKSAAELAGTDSDKAVWAYEKQALLIDRNNGWPSDKARLGNAEKADTQQLLEAGPKATSEKLAACQVVINQYFPQGHPAT